VLDRQELEEMIKSLYQPTKAEITMFVKRFDKNNDGKISFKEFRSGIQKMNPRYRMPENEPFIAALFKRCVAAARARSPLAAFSHPQPPTLAAST
jgi:Ca2+-binding EF-hand superfamily protein